MIAFDDFLAFARQRHAGQTSKSGEPYIEHILRVVQNTKAIWAALPQGMVSEEDQQEALLVAIGHDLIEDGRATVDEVISLGGSQSLIRRLGAISRMEPKPVYQAWITAIADAGDIVVLVVKIADNLDNNSAERIAALPSEMQSIRKRYDRAFQTLKAGLDRLVADYVARSASEAAQN